MRVSSGSARSLPSEDQNCSGVPSNMRPQPSANSVSPQKSARLSSNQKAIWPLVWPGTSKTRAVCVPTV